MTRRREEFPTKAQLESFAPLHVLHVELSQQLPDISMDDEKTDKQYKRAFCVVRLHDHPLGIVEFQLNDGITYASDYTQTLWDSVHLQLNAHLQQDGLPKVRSLEEVCKTSHAMPRCIEEREQFYANAPFVSVVVCTHDRPETLSMCIDSLLHLHYPKYEIILVDNAPSTPLTAELIQHTYGDIEHIRYVRESRPGLSLARNCGANAAKGEIIAFTDDDVVVDKNWLLELIRGFSTNNIACVTGLILPLEQETFAQYIFETYGGFSKGFVKKTFDASDLHVHLYKAGLFGAGANMAFTASFLQSIRGFDPALGAGSPSLSAEETAAYLQVIMHNYSIVYNPAAIVSHLHRRDYKSLRTQMYNYGVGYTAYLIKSVMEHPKLLFVLLTTVPYSLLISLVFRSRQDERRKSSSWQELTMLGRKGMLHGLFAYAHSRWVVRHTLNEPAPDLNTQVDYIPVYIKEIDLENPVSTFSTINEKTGQRYQRVRILVRLHDQPLGTVEFQTDEKEILASKVVHNIWETLSTEINQHLEQDGLAPVTSLDEAGLICSTPPQCIQEREDYSRDAPFVSIIVPTNNRLEYLQTCLSSLLALNYPDYEIIVVDNAPSSPATADLIQHKYSHITQVRYLREDRPGVSWARNRGIEFARGEIIAFTDDDVVVDRNWLLTLIKAFSVTSNVTCVTGIVLPQELETPSQFWFEEYGGFTQDLSRRIFNMKEYLPKNILYPYAGSFGAGANMAIKKSFLYEVNGFDPALGGSGPSRCSQDTALFFQVITHGHTLVYEPGALVYHNHRREYKALRKQIYNYGIGFTAFLTKSIFDNPVLLFDLLIKVPYGVLRMLNTQSPKNSKKSSHYPEELTKIERKGMLYGPFAYLLTLWMLRKMDKRLVVQQCK